MAAQGKTLVAIAGQRGGRSGACPPPGCARGTPAGRPLSGVRRAWRAPSRRSAAPGRGPRPRRRASPRSAPPPSSPASVARSYSNRNTPLSRSTMPATVIVVRSGTSSTTNPAVFVSIRTRPVRSCRITAAGHRSLLHHHARYHRVVVWRRWSSAWMATTAPPGGWPRTGGRPGTGCQEQRQKRVREEGAWVIEMQRASPHSDSLHALR